MIHTLMDEVLMTLVVLWCLVVISGLLLLWSLPLPTVVELTRSILYVPLGATISIVSHLTTSKARVATSGNRGIVPNRRSSRGALVILQ
jgi:hypothetical protein